MRQEMEHSRRRSGSDLVNSDDGDDGSDRSERVRRTRNSTGDNDKDHYIPSKEELRFINKVASRLAQRPLAPRVKVEEGKLSLDHPEPFIGQVVMAGALGTGDLRISSGLISQSAQASARDGKIDERRLNFTLAVVQALKPRDEIEAMLAAQMAATHMAAMEYAGRLGQADFTPQLDSCVGAFNKLTRTFVAQVGVLKQYRSETNGPVVVKQTVAVTEGGQAIVGTVHQTPKELPENGPPPSIPDAPAPLKGAQRRREPRIPRAKP